MNHLKRASFFTFLFTLIIFDLALAQEPNFSMFHYTPVFTNPGRIGVVEDVQLMLNYRNQSVEAGDNFTASTLSLFYPINVGNHRLVLAGSFLNDQASDFVSTNGGLLGAAYSVRLSAQSELSLGLQTGFFRRNTEGSFTTDDQFVDGVFNPNISSGDAVLNMSTNYTTLSGGVFYRLKDEYGREKGFVGGSIFNAIEPNISLVDDNNDNLPSSFKATAGYRVYQGTKLSVLPNLRVISQSDNSFLNVGSRFGYELESTDEGAKRIELGAWYNTNDLGVFSLAYEQPNLIIAASYDIPVGNTLGIGQNGIFEIAVSLRLKKKSRPYVPKSTADQVEPTQVEEEQTEEEVQEPEEEQIEEEDTAEEEEVQLAIEEEPEEEIEEEQGAETVADTFDPGKLDPEEKLVLSRTVRFDFNTNTLDQDSKTFLDEVSVILLKKNKVEIELVGHSCNIGPEQANVDLSMQRAESVKSYLVNKGINESRFKVSAEGEASPVEDNGTERGRQQNRRVEFKVEEK